MAERPVYVRSSARAYPRVDQQDGLIAEDIDGDGRILSMRVPDDNGVWRQYPEDPRLMIPRDPDDDGSSGPYFRLLTEGRIQNFDGVTIKYAPRLQGLDMNRNYPVEWRPEGEQLGAGPYPTSEPEIRATVQAIVDRPNICAFIQYHTMSGVHLRPYGTKADDALPTVDLRVFKKIGEKATELTGYPAVSVYHDFRYDPKDVITGVADDWAYDHLGVHAWTTEFWNPFKVAGVEDYKFIEWSIDHPFDDDLKILAWCDEELGADGFVDWYPYDHPELGPVELGGFNSAYFIRNPPPHLIEKEIAPHADFAIYHIAISPKLALREFTAEKVGDDTWRVRLVVANTGWLPTNVTEKAKERKIVRPLEVELALPADVAAAGAKIVGEAKVELGQLSGRALKHAMLSGAADPTVDLAKADWVVRAPAGSELSVEARHQRAGTVRASLTL